MKTVIIVIDSFGVGELPDASKFGDEGSNTMLNIHKQTPLNVKNMTSFGLKDIDGINIKHKEKLVGSFGKMKEKTFAKDTTAGHFELMGLTLKRPYPVFPNGFPEKLLKKIEKKIGGKYKFIGNCVASGTEIIKTLGDQVVDENKLIVYTSADSVFQVAAHVGKVPLEELYRICEISRKVLKGKYSVGRVIARPFAGEKGAFYRTNDRKDYALPPPKKTALDAFMSHGFDTVAIGKIEDIFLMQGIKETVHTKTNDAGLEEIIKQSKRRDINGLVFANLVDTDMLFGHRNDVNGYADALEKIDAKIPEIMSALDEHDFLVITADHGCDPTTPSTDHSREYVPLLVWGKDFKAGVNLGTINGFDTLAKSLLDYYGIKKYSDSIFTKLKK